VINVYRIVMCLFDMKRHAHFGLNGALAIMLIGCLRSFHPQDRFRSITQISV